MSDEMKRCTCGHAEDEHGRDGVCLTLGCDCKSFTHDPHGEPEPGLVVSGGPDKETRVRAKTVAAACLILLERLSGAEREHTFSLVSERFCLRCGEGRHVDTRCPHELADREHDEDLERHLELHRSFGGLKSEDEVR